MNGARACFAAGAALAALDVLVWPDGVPAPFAGAFLARQALAAAAGGVRVARLREDEAELRDALRTASPAGNTSPAGRIHRLWRLSARRPPPRDAGDFERAGELLGGAADFGKIADSVRRAAAGSTDPIGGAVQAGLDAATVAAAGTLHPLDAEILALWTADAALATRLGWERAVPLLATRIADPALFVDGRRARPADPNWGDVATRAYALAAAAAYDGAVDLARRAAKLIDAAPKLRAKPAGRVVDMMLDDDCVTAAEAVRATGMSPRAARRLLERLVELDAVRELSGRETFRMYGL